MTRMLKTLGLSLMAVMALGAVMASGAQAGYHVAGAADTVHAVGPTAPGNHFTVHTRTGGTLNVECEENEFEVGEETTGTLETGTLPVAAEYGECQLGGLAASVNMGSCSYLFEEPVEGEGGTKTATVSVVCGAQPITINGVGCKVTVGGQSELGHVVFHNEGNHVLATVTVSGITYTMYSGCPKVEGASETRSNGEYSEDVTVTAKNGASDVAISVK